MTTTSSSQSSTGGTSTTSGASTPTVTSRVPVRDATLHVERTGAGPALVFVHGMMGDARGWQGQVDRLADDFTCIAYDRRGHSRSTAGTRDQSPMTHADDLAALVEGLGVGGCLLVGSSGGAAVGVEVLRRHPGLVAGAVLSEPPLLGLDPEAGGRVVADIRAAAGPALERGDLGAAADAFMGVMCPRMWERLPEERRAHFRANAGLLLPTLQAPSNPLGEADLARVTTPVWVVTGALSHPGARRISRRLAEALARAELVELPASGHVTYAEQPDAFAAVVRTAAGTLARA